MTITSRLALRTAAVWGLLFLFLLAFAAFAWIGSAPAARPLIGRWISLVLVVFGLGVLLASLLLALGIRRFVRRPLERLADESRRAAGGEAARALPEEGLADEIKGAVKGFNAMAREVEAARALLAARAAEAEGSLARREQELHRARRVASAGALAAAFAHDLANPISGMRAAAERLLPALPPGEARESAALLAEGLDRLEARVREILRFAREEPRRAPFPLRAAAEAAARFVAHRLSGKGVRIEIEAPPGLSALGDADEAAQVLLNLLLNAADAAPAGSVIRVRGGPAGERVWLEVEDEGAGMDPETLARAFEPFYTTKEGKGSGLGLFVSRAILRHAGGDLLLESAPGRGTRARAILPAAPA